MDARLLGLSRRHLCVERRLLGAARRLYGGINYGFGYGGVVTWAADGRPCFAYNRAVNNLGTVRVTNVYEEKITINNVTRVSFNGGPGGVALRPTPEEGSGREGTACRRQSCANSARADGGREQRVARHRKPRPAGDCRNREARRFRRRCNCRTRTTAGPVLHQPCRAPTSTGEREEDPASAHFLGLAKEVCKNRITRCGLLSFRQQADGTGRNAKSEGIFGKPDLGPKPPANRGE